MSAAVTYTTFGNTIVHERRNGVDHDYMRDPLGSTVGLLNSSQQISDTFAYWPYGEIQSQTGSTGTPFTFCGTLGYFLDLATQLCYVRARHLAIQLARWLTADPLWPGQSPYEYAGNRPSDEADPSGALVMTGPSLTEVIIELLAAAGVAAGEFLSIAALAAAILIALGSIAFLWVLACDLARELKYPGCYSLPSACSPGDNCLVLQLKTTARWLCLVGRVGEMIFCVPPWNWDRTHMEQIESAFGLWWSCFFMVHSKCG